MRTGPVFSPRKAQGIIHQRHTRRVSGATDASGDSPVNILASLTGLMLIPAVLATGDDRTPAREPARDQARGKPRADWVPPRPGPWLGTIRAARSTDGLQFQPVEAVAIRFANAPAVTRLPDGRLLLVYEYFSRTNRRDFGRLGFSCSKDDGKTWSPPEPLEIRRLSRRVGRPRGPVFMKTSSGPLELYFVCDDPKGRQTILAARLSTDGATDKKDVNSEIVFEIRDKVRLEDKKIKLDDPALANIAGTLHIYATLRGRPVGMFHGIFPTPTRIDGKGMFGLADFGKPGVVIRAAESWRLYGSAAEGIVSATSADGYDWSREEGLRLKEAADPAVVRLAGDAYLMLYVEHVQPPRRDDQLSTEGAAEPSEEQGPDLETWYAAIDDQAPAPADTDLSTDPAATDGLDPALEAADSIDPENALALVQEHDASQIPDADDADGPVSEADDFTTENDAEPSYCFGDVPIPDFKRHVDYRAWMEQRQDTAGIVENAYDYYEAFMPMPGDEPGDKPEWPQFNSMFHEAGRVGPPEPWDPADHPEWEATFLASAELEEKYAQAATIADYVTPVILAKPSLPSEVRDRDSENLLLNVMLPTLSPHRAMVKQILGDAWRAPGGQLDPQRMLDAFQTTLSSADQLSSNSIFLIETLVSVAEKNLVEDSARRALQHKVFSADEMETALETFIERDRPLPDPAELLKGELTWALDYSQYVYGPIEPNRKPTFNPARAAYVGDMATEEAGPRLSEEQIAAADPHETVETFVNYYQTVGDMMRRGYPEVRPADLEALQEAAVAEDYTVRQMLPALSRYYQLTNRSEASRRATQLSYAIHLYEARNGQWPRSLDDLPPRYTQGVRTDPFSGGDFVYRVTENGPMLYSTSENGRDDGGSHHRRWGDEQLGNEDGDDHVFWPPQ